ncbi:MAG: uracil-DNA glycosylase [Betaproteobacteria bacterium RIFCSPLOWO2_12_FULL_68_19]|nr:MAG: uracil-DNA glycosylase [Betaproteobacteria bacterium RIFCSPLOWO2_12_FULL_68_19]
MGSAAFRAVVAEARACVACRRELPHAPRPVFHVGAAARLLIVGQAPGRRVHETGIPWNDPSGEALREWLAMDRATFYDSSRIAIVPAGLCYPGTVGGSDLPPRPECAPRWQPRFRAALPGTSLTLLIGIYAQAYWLGARRKKTLSETVGAYRDYLPEFFPLPHPSWRNRAWLKKNPWFADQVIPELRQRVKRCIGQV